MAEMGVSDGVPALTSKIFLVVAVVIIAFSMEVVKVGQRLITITMVRCILLKVDMPCSCFRGKQTSELCTTFRWMHLRYGNMVINRNSTLDLEPFS